jgi:hypothetical protein
MPKSKNNKLCRIGSTEVVDVNTGESVPVENGGFHMLPGPPGTCEYCHVEHDPKQPHNQQSLSYQMKFHAITGRWPTWSDAMAHCEPEVQSHWRQELRRVMRENGLPIPDDLKE